WSIIAGQLPGRTDNDIKNYWNTKLKRKLLDKHQLKDQNGSQQPTVSKRALIKGNLETIEVTDAPEVMMNSYHDHQRLYDPKMIPLVSPEDYQCPINYGFSYTLQDRICRNSSMDVVGIPPAIDSSTSEDCSRISGIDGGMDKEALESFLGHRNTYFPHQPTSEVTVYGDPGLKYDEFTSLYWPIDLDNNIVVDVSSRTCNPPTLSYQEVGLQDESVQSILLEDPRRYFGLQ
ncbi:hypothetical protein CRG98_046596, partial [Punica granatum]